MQNYLKTITLCCYYLLFRVKLFKICDFDFYNFKKRDLKCDY